MKYENVEHKLEDSIDVVVNGILRILFAPLNLTKDISQRILFLDKGSLQKLSNVMMITQGAFILTDLFNILRTREFHLMGGTPPLMIKVLVFICSMFVVNWIIDRASDIYDSGSIIHGLEFDDESEDESVEESVVSIETTIQPPKMAEIEELQLESLFGAGLIGGADTLDIGEVERAPFSLEDDEEEATEPEPDFNVYNYLYGLGNTDDEDGK